MDFSDPPWPLMQVAVEPKTEAGRQRLVAALSALLAEDGYFQFHSDAVSGAAVIGSNGEIELDKVIDRLRRELDVEFRVGAPQVAYRETITRRHEQDYTHKKQTGGTGQFARVKIVFEPNADSEAYAFESKIVGGAVPKEFIPGVEKGINSVMSSGPFAGFPMIAVKAIGNVIGDLNSRRGQIQGQEARGVAVVINAMVPLANMFKLEDRLRTITKGQANVKASFARYDPVEMPDDGYPPLVA